MPLELVEALNAPGISARVDAIEKLARQPDDARPKLAAILVDVRSGTRARIWAMIALCQVGGDAGNVAVQALVRCVDDSEAAVRRSAIDVLGHLGVASAASRIAAHLSDHEAVKEGWFDDDSTPSQAAGRALKAIGTPEALALLAESGDR